MRGDAGFPVRLRAVKRGRVRFISHRDVARAFERAFRIERLPLAFTQGFSPRPKVSFGLALSVGHESDAEYLDVELAAPVDPGVLPDALTAALPEGIAVIGAAELVERAPALQEAVTAVEWEIEVVHRGGDVPQPGEVGASVAAAMAAAALPVARARKGRETLDDIRPALRRVQVLADPHRVLLRVEVSTRPRGARPPEIVAALGADLAPGAVLRTHQWIERGGARLEPLEADARRVVEARAS